MLKLTNEQLQTIFNGLNEGKSYCGIKNDKGIGSITNFSEDYFEIQHYGSIKVQKSVKRLQSAIEIMFNDCDEIVEAYYSEYHCNYVPVDKKYTKIDLSTSHPNVFGK